MIKYFAMSDYYILIAFFSINMLTLDHCLLPGIEEDSFLSGLICLLEFVREKH